MEEENYKELVQRYLEKKSTDEELEVFVYLMKQGKLDSYLEETMNTDLGLDQDQIRLPETKRWFRLFLWPMAAAVTLTAGMLFFFSARKQQTDSKIVTHVIYNSARSVLRKVLPDGSIVWLNPGARFTYPSRFGKFRAVSMQGEIFFEVAKDQQHPFLISSGMVLTKVWGTSFRVRSVPGEKVTKVSVLTGKVSVSSVSKIKKEIMLLPEEEVSYNKADQDLLKTPIELGSDMMVWRKAELSFEDTELSAIIPALSRYYHVPIFLKEEKLKKYKLTADFKGKNLPDILVLICKSVQCSYTSIGKEITLSTANQQFNHL
nr:FecR family protein [Pedobacter sp. ASV19]